MTFSDLPFDVKLQIFASCRPLDIIRGLRQTSRDLHGVSVEPSLWKRILNQTHFENRLLLLSQVEIDNMPLRSLEYTATAPSRFASTLWRRDTRAKQLKPHISRKSFYLVDQGLRHNGFLPETLRRFELIPGGRYLLSEHRCSSSDDDTIFDSARILLWDLQASIRSHRAFTSIKPLAILKGRYCVAPLHPTSDMKGFLLLTRDTQQAPAAGQEQQEERFSIYQIHPTSTPPSFHLVSEHPTRMRMPFGEDPRGTPGYNYSLAGQRALMVENTEITVWDFVCKTSRSWRASPLEVDDSFPIVSAALTDNHVILCCRVSILIWRVPVLSPVGSDLSKVVQPLEPCLKINLNEWLPWVTAGDHIAGDHMDRRFLCVDNWYYTSSASRSFQVDHCVSGPPPQNDQTSVHRYSIHLPEAGSVHQKPKVLEVTRLTENLFSRNESGPRTNPTDTLQMPYQPVYQYFDHYKFLYRIKTCDDVDSTNGTAFMHCEALDSKRGTSSPKGGRIHQLKLPRGAYVPQGSGFCPATGRMCYVNVLDARWNKFGPSLIEIVDFISSPGRNVDDSL